MYNWMEESVSVNRRKFLQQAGTLLVSGGIAGTLPSQAFAGDGDLTTLTILHTNDVHSRIEPFPMDGSAIRDWVAQPGGPR